MKEISDTDTLFKAADEFPNGHASRTFLLALAVISRQLSRIEAALTAPLKDEKGPRETSDGSLNNKREPRKKTRTRR